MVKLFEEYKAITDGQINSNLHRLPTNIKFAYQLKRCRQFG